MKKLKNGRWKHQKATNEEIRKTLDEMKSVVDTYGWELEKLSPYGYDIKIGDLLKSWEAFDKCTSMSKEIMISEINGTIEILNHWVSLKKENQVNVTLINGKTMTVAESTARELRAIGAIQ